MSAVGDCGGDAAFVSVCVGCMFFSVLHGQTSHRTTPASQSKHASGHTTHGTAAIKKALPLDNADIDKNKKTASNSKDTITVESGL